MIIIGRTEMNSASYSLGSRILTYFNKEVNNVGNYIITSSTLVYVNPQFK